MRGSASSRIVGFVSVFLILPFLKALFNSVTPPRLDPPSLSPSHFSPSFNWAFFFPSPIAPPTISWPSRLDDAAANGRFPTVMPLTRVVEAPTTCSVLGTVAGWRKKFRFAMAVRVPNIVSCTIQKGNLIARRASSFWGNIPLPHFVLPCNGRKSRKIDTVIMGSGSRCDAHAEDHGQRESTQILSTAGSNGNDKAKSQQHGEVSSYPVDFVKFSEVETLL